MRREEAARSPDHPVVGPSSGLDDCLGCKDGRPAARPVTSGTAALTRRGGGAVVAARPRDAHGGRPFEHHPSRPPASRSRRCRETSARSPASPSSRRSDSSWGPPSRGSRFGAPCWARQSSWSSSTPRCGSSGGRPHSRSTRAASGSAGRSGAGASRRATLPGRRCCPARPFDGTSAGASASARAGSGAASAGSTRGKGSSTCTSRARIASSWCGSARAGRCS